MTSVWGAFAISGHQLPDETVGAATRSTRDQGLQAERLASKEQTSTPENRPI
jgi:hypothetical protein